MGLFLLRPFLLSALSLSIFLSLCFSLHLSVSFPLLTLSADAIHTKDGKEFILELKYACHSSSPVLSPTAARHRSDTAIGLAPDHEPEDNNLIRDIVLQRLADSWAKKNVEKKAEKADEKKEAAAASTSEHALTSGGLV